MKKAILIILALVLLVSFAACGKKPAAPVDDAPVPSDSTPAPTSASAPEPTAEPEPEPSSEPAPEPAKETDYEITYMHNQMWVNSIGTTWTQTIIEITNTGSVPLYLGNVSYDLEDESGSLLATQSLVSVYPTVLDVGEKGYMYDETTFDGAPVDNVTILPHIKAEKAKIDNVRYPVSDVKITDGTFGLKVIGRIENNTAEDASMPEVAVVLFNADGEPIGLVFTYVMDGVPAGDKAGFEASGLTLPDSVTADAVADYVVFAYPGLQLQF